MAERRMFAKTIIDSDAFLDMPLSTQALYFHLSMRADDDGFINNPKKIQRMIGASDDDLKVLIAKNFIIPFESGIVVIKHWRIHNYIRGDRKHETNYSDEMSLLTVKDNGAYTLCPSNGCQVTDTCQPNVSIGKDRIGKDSIDKDNTPRSNAKRIVDLFHEKCPSLPKVIKITDKRVRTINARLNDNSEDNIILAFEKAESSDFLREGSSKWRGADFDWIMNKNNLVKILEGKYDNRATQKDGMIRTHYDFDELNKFIKEN